MNARAVIFDLDNTLYPERRFILSGFAAVACDVEARDGVRACTVFRQLVASLRHGHRPTAFQRLADTHDLSPARIAEWVAIVRNHVPRLRLARETHQLLADLRTGWRVGLVSNGIPAVQQRKIDALNLAPLLDYVSLPGVQGQGGKPAPDGFLAACHGLGVLPRRAVFVGDNFMLDVLGAKNAGLHAIHLAPATCLASRGGGADAIVTRLDEVGPAAEALLQDGYADAD